MYECLTDVGEEWRLCDVPITSIQINLKILKVKFYKIIFSERDDFILSAYTTFQQCDVMDR